MANNLIHTTAVRNMFGDQLEILVDAGAGFADLHFYLADTTTEVAKIILQDPAFGAAASGVITLLGVPISDTSPTGNAAAIAHFKIRDPANLEILSGEVGTSGSDINMSSLIVAATDEVRLDSLTWTAPT